MIRILKKNIVIPPRYFLNYEEYIHEILEEMVGKNFSHNYGFLKSIMEIKEIENKCVSTSDFSGAIIYSVIFKAEFIKPQTDELIECYVEHNANIILATAEHMKIIVVENEETKNLEVGDKIIIRTKMIDIKTNQDCIKIVGEYVEKTE